MAANIPATPQVRAAPKEPRRLSQRDAQARSAHSAADPVVKWAGGKRRLVPEVESLFPEPPVMTYWEPFVGGAAVFLSVGGAAVEGSVLSDLNGRLMLTYQMLAERCDAVIDRLEEMAARHSEAHYYRVRSEYNAGADDVTTAAAFIYLNRTGFNGLYRENRKGEFNVPYGHRRFTHDAGNLRAAAAMLARADLRIGDFSDIDPGKNDVVYCDPPYHDTFTGYVGNAFTEDDQIRLRDACRSWADAGATVIVSNSLNPFTRRIYNGFDIHEVVAARTINRDGAGRRPVREMLAVLHP